MNQQSEQYMNMKYDVEINIQHHVYVWCTSEKIV